MKRAKNLIRILLLTCLHTTGVWCEEEAVFIYSKVRSEILLPCNNLVSHDCSKVSWTFFFKGGGVQLTEEVTAGKVRPGTDKKISVLSNCSLLLRDLKPTDAGSYGCLHNGKATCNVYLSILSITSSSPITELRPGGNLSLGCALYTYFDAGSCKLDSSLFRLSWTTGDGANLPRDKRYELINHSSCLYTLTVTNLQRDDNMRSWRCQVNTSQISHLVFLDIQPTFLTEGPSNVHSLTSSDDSNCSEQLPISRIVLCVALPVMVIVVGLFTWSVDRQRAKASAADTEKYEFQ